MLPLELRSFLAQHLALVALNCLREIVCTQDLEPSFQLLSSSSQVVVHSLILEILQPRPHLGVEVEVSYLAYFLQQVTEVVYLNHQEEVVVEEEANLLEVAGEEEAARLSLLVIRINQHFTYPISSFSSSHLLSFYLFLVPQFLLDANPSVQAHHLPYKQHLHMDVTCTLVYLLYKAI